MQITIGELTDILGGCTTGDRDVMITGVSKIEEGKPNTISFYSNPKYEQFVYSSEAAAILVENEFEPTDIVRPTLIRVPNVYEALAKLMEKFADKLEDLPTGISDHAIIDPSVSIGQNVYISDFVVIEAGVVLSDGVRIESNVHIGRNSSIGSDSVLKSGVKIMHACVIGNNCIIHANTVIGADGFGFAKTNEGNYVKIQQQGNVVIGNNVEIGSNCSIDRASLGSTLIKDGVKLDNLIQIAHNVEIGENTVIAAQTGIAGSAKIGKECRIGGQVGIAGHITIADGTEIQAQSGVQSSIKEPNSRLFGSPALEYNNYLRSYSIFRRLPQLARIVGILEKSASISKDKDSY